MNREDIIMMAVQVGQAIKNSELMEKYEASSDAYSKDTELQAQISEYNTDQEALSQENAKENPDEYITKALSERIDELYSLITHNARFEEFAGLQDQIRGLLDEINNVITAQITGHGEGGCTGNCASCGGCH